MNARPDIYLDYGYDRIIANRSGVLDATKNNGSFFLWLVVEDAQDICSVGLDKPDIEALITYLQGALKEADNAD